VQSDNQEFRPVVDRMAGWSSRSQFSGENRGRASAISGHWCPGYAGHPGPFWAREPNGYGRGTWSRVGLKGVLRV